MEPELIGGYGRLLSLSYPQDAYEKLFRRLTPSGFGSLSELRERLKAQVDGKVCRNRVTDVFDEALHEPKSAACLAYILAWLRVAGENSVLPPLGPPSVPADSGPARQIAQQALPSGELPLLPGTPRSDLQLETLFRLFRLPPA
ncbi:MAG: hypothetical protein GY801_34950 [bacterium]|nr:hypothetical protein [bacterium]